MKANACALTLMLCTGAVPADAEEIRGFDPSKSCVEILSNTGGGTDQFMIAAWVFGFLAAQDGTLRPVTPDNNKVLLQNLTKACIERGGAPLLELVQANRPAAEAAPAQPSGQAPAGLPPGSEAEARARLMEFLQPGTDRARLTWAMKPTDADIRAVYAEPLAGKLIAAYGEMFTPSVAIGPKEGQTEVLTWYATTRELREGNPVLKEFPGGYKKAVGFMQGDYPILRFKFVEPGETLGLAFDGLIFVNDRWVLMPKPWRYLEE
ncbi:MAG: hypothetical protein R3D85_08290 [Paracoccaceae bacterium]